MIFLKNLFYTGIQTQLPTCRHIDLKIMYHGAAFKFSTQKYMTDLSDTSSFLQLNRKSYNLPFPTEISIKLCI